MYVRFLGKVGILYNYFKFQGAIVDGPQGLLHISHPYTAQYVDDFDDLAFNTQIFRRHLERLILVSGPVQDFLIQLQNVYRWDDPAATAGYMMLYFGLWYVKHLITFAVGKL